MANGDVLQVIADHQALAPLEASAVTYDPAVLGETDGQAVAEALAAGTLSIVEADLSAAQLKTLTSAPTTLVAGVAGKAYWPVAAFGFYNAGDAAFADFSDFVVGACDVPITSTFSVLDSGTGAITAIQGTTDGFFTMTGGSGGTFAPKAALDGAPLRIFSTGGDMTAGNGTIRLWVLYRVMDVPA